MRQEILDDALKLKSLIGIRTNGEDWDELIIGFVTELNDLSLTINEIDRNGLLSGSAIILLDNIISLDYSDRYQKRLKFIHENCASLNPNKQIAVWKGGAELTDHFNSLIQSKKIATFYFDEENYVLGIILNFDLDYVLIKNIGREGDEDGTSCHLINKITGLKYDGMDEQKIKMLYENRSIFYNA